MIYLKKHMDNTINNYLKWYSDNFQVKNIGSSDNGEIYEILLPYFNKNKTQLSIYFQETKNKIIVSDLSETVLNIISSGFNLTDLKKETMSQLAKSVDIDFTEENEIYFEHNKIDSFDKFCDKFQATIQLIYEIDSMSIFTESQNLKLN